MRNVTLVLEDGTKFHGKSFGYDNPVAGEVVFNTAMMGYPESLTDPSYAGQLMVLTYPLVGNYGVPPFTVESNGIATFMESDKIYASAIIVADYSEQYNHWNAAESLAEWLKREHVPGITGIDTRELTKVLREHGVMMGKIIFDDEPDNIPTANYEGVNFVDQVSCKEIIRYNEGAGKKVVLVDCGVKNNIIRCLVDRGAEVIRVPWNYDYTNMDFDEIVSALEKRNMLDILDALVFIIMASDDYRLSSTDPFTMCFTPKLSIDGTPRDDFDIEKIIKSCVRIYHFTEMF